MAKNEDRATPTVQAQAGQGSSGQQLRQSEDPAGLPPPRGPSGKAILAVLVVSGLMLWIGIRWGDRIRGWVERADTQEKAGQVAATARYYTCSMHPWVILPKPGLCPVCHMDLVPLDPAKLTGKVEIDPQVVQNMGVRVVPVQSGPLTQTIRTVGTVDYNETAIRDVNLKLAGWIEELHVNYLGEPVKQGQPLFELYAPELYAAQQEYLLAYRGAARLPAAATQGPDEIAQAARTRLEYYDISPEQIQALEQRGQAAKTMTIYSPHTGVVTVKNAFEGMRVEPGTQLYRIADLSSVWVMVTLYEYQLPYVQVGQQAVMTLPYIPGEQFEGKVIYIYPTLDEKTRQVRVRLEFANPQGLLKPGMFAEVQLRSTLAEDRVLVPREAIIDTGQRQVAFVSLGDGKFEPRDVQMGVQTDNGVVQVLSGLKPGEMVVTSGQFLLDSESRVREALAKMVKGQAAATQKAAAAPASAPTESVLLPTPAQDALVQVLGSYQAIGDKLAADTVEGIASPARQIAQAIDTMLKTAVQDDPHFWHRHEEVATVRSEALHLAGESDLAKARLAYADLSIALARFLQAVGVPASYDKPVEQLHCPMYREGQGGTIWLQGGGEVRNPYFGKSMLRCFDKREAMPKQQGAEERVQGSGFGVQESTGQSQQGKVGRPHVASRPTSQAASQQSIDSLVRSYLAIQAKLASNQFDGVNDHLREMRSAATTFENPMQHDPSTVSPGLASVIRAVATDCANIGEARIRLAELTDFTVEFTKAHPPTLNAAPSIYRAYCPMVKKAWLQAGEDIRNPYDPTMPECGHLTSDNLIAGDRKE